MQRLVRLLDPRRERSIGEIAAIALLALVGLALGGAADPSDAATSCVVLPREGKLPPHAAEARRNFASYVPENPGGLEVQAEQARQNRKDLAEGRITAREAEDRGGLAVGGTFAIPVLATLYNDTDSDAVPAVASLSLQLFGPSFTQTMTQYYEEVSYGNLNLTGTVFGWRRASLPMSSYTIPNNGLGGPAKDYVRDAIARHDATVNFANFDNDGDGYVDIVCVVYPTRGAECMGTDLNMWSHHSYLTGNGGLPAFTADGVLVDRYFVAPAISCEHPDSLIEIAVFCHEMGHALGIKDLYDREDGPFYEGDSEGIGDWGLMGAGGDDPRMPSHMEAFSKERLGWLTYLNIPSDTHLCLPPVETNPVAARVWSQGSIGPEYFVAENRQLIGSDASLPASGLVIYHVDEDVYDELESENDVNAFETHKAIDVECADASAAGNVVDADDLDSKANRGDSGDVWCSAGGGQDFTANSIPDTRAYSGEPTGVAIENVGSCTNDPTTQPGWVCADYTVGITSPVNLCIEDCATDNCNEIATCGEYWASPNIWINNDDDFQNEIPAEGIDNKLWVRFTNLGPDAWANARAMIWAAQGTAGLEWPDDADTLLGFAGVNIIGPGDVVEDQLVFEYPELFDYEGHYCIGVVLQEALPIGSMQANMSNNIAQVNSQVFFARAGGAAKAMACPGPFSKSSQIYLRDGYNPSQEVRKAIVRVGSPPGFNNAVIPVGWSLSILPSMGPFFLSPGMRDSITVRVSSPMAAHGQTAHIPITLWDTDQNVTIGGVTIDVTIDCNDPQAPQNGSAEWTTLSGDDIGGQTVRVQWDPVLFDVMDGPETIKFYEVFLSLDTGLPYASAGKVAIDAEPLMPGFQWYDDLPRDHCPAQATYVVRAIDGADGFGSFSDPILVPCAATSLDGPANGALAEGFTRAAPNPFQKSTAIDFSLPVAGELALEIFNTQGERVRTLAVGHESAGHHRLVWDGLDDDQRPAVSGIYFYRMTAPGIRETRKIVLSR